MDDDGAAEEILESIDTTPQFQEEVWLPRDAVVGPAHELDVGHLPLCVLLSLLQTRPHIHGYVDVYKNIHIY